MSERKIDSLERGMSPEGVGGSKPETREASIAPPPSTVDVNYPDPTPLSAVLRDVARWSGYSFVMEPSVNARVQIFAPRRLAPEQAYELFLISLSVVGLRAVQIGTVVKVVPVQLSVSA